MSNLKEQLIFLDCALTGKTQADAIHMSKNQDITRDRLYYLSDGGYSRIVFNDDTCKIFLASESTDKVKTAWSRCEELIADVEKTLTEWVKNEYE